MTVNVIGTDADTWVDENQPSMNFGNDVQVRLLGASDRRGFFHFGLPRGLMWLGGHVREVLLRVWLANDWTGETLTIKRIVDDWDESTVTWDNKPSVDATNSVSLPITGLAGSMIEIDVTDIFDDVVGGDPYSGLELSVSGGAIYRRLIAAENPDQTKLARLSVDWTLLPEGPINLRPADGGVISVGAPVLAWQFAPRDYHGETEQANSNVQVATDEAFTNIVFDSGWVANTSHLYDLSSSSYTPNANGTTRYWRVRVKDDFGRASDWSDIASWEREPKGTLTLVRPANTGGGEVNDTTPTIVNTFVGQTQESKEIFVYQYDGDDRILHWHYPETVTSDLSTAIPQKFALKSGEQYQVVLRVWDDLPRESIPGDRDYVQVTRDFFYNKAGAVDPVINLTANTFGSSPGVVLTFHIAASPLWFTVRRDDKEVIDFIDPSEASQGGDEYQWIDWTAPPGEQYEYEVEAVEIATVSGVAQLAHSSGNDTDIVTPRPWGVWLIDPEDDTTVQFVDKNDVEWDVRRQGTTYDIPKRRDPVQVVTGIGGYGGSFEGRIIEENFKDNFEDLIGRGPRDFRLVLAKENIAIQLEGGAPAPTPIGDGGAVWNGQFTFFQVDDYTFSVKGLTGGRRAGWD